MSIYYVAGIAYSSELCHHGINGQKWGKRNGPPYPLKPEDHSKSEQKAGWRESLKNYRDYSGEKKKLRKEAVKKYYAEVRTSPEYIAKKHLHQEEEKIRKSLKKKYPQQAKNDELVRNIARGVAVAAIVGSVAYVGVNSASYAKAFDVQLDITAKYMDEGHRAASVIAKTMDIDISKLSDSDEVITAGTTLQRVIRDYGDTKNALSMEKAKDFIYATFDKNDNEIYKTLFNARGSGKKLITTRDVVEDLKMPSAFKRATAFTDLLKDKSFADLFKKDLEDSGLINKYSKRDLSRLSNGKLYNLFNIIAGNSGMKSPKLYFDKISQMGYNAIRDDNDSGYLGKTPLILLNASKDTILIGHKKATQISEMMSRFKLENVPEYDRKTIFK